ncbi:NAD-dependent epimerase/dehydratase family protein [Intrasporangium calvum]|uniref:NAD-dependent epimerase/dehydratase family protein n=1 Tax=Intrasporangium calvum TaxID=53358 RepID=UPI000DF62CD3|nr:NAD(P)-dependent oxidoreductase [Intrasporangium calvum]AXG15036.1 NAD(P)-dependent oxidoreductase [Intrasporangium calvum]
MPRGPPRRASPALNRAPATAPCSGLASAGASGALGRTLTPALVAAGHDVFGTTRTGNPGPITAAGATPLTMDGLDRTSVLQAVEEAKPDVIIHQLTALRTGIDPKHFDTGFATTNRLRTEGTDHLLEAARTFGVGRVLAQSFTGFTNPRTGPGLADETSGYDPDPAPKARQTLVSKWLQALAEALGAKPPRRLPLCLARPLLGEHGVNLMTKIRGSSNAKAKRELAWTLQYPTWRVGFATGL